MHGKKNNAISPLILKAVKKYIFILLLTALITNKQTVFSQMQASFKPGEIWNDTEGNPINAHGGGILYFNNTYYWFGEIKKGTTWRVPYVTTWEDYRVVAGGISCYSSKDLLNWKNEGVALAPNTEDSSSDIHTSRVIERPKVIYNASTKKFVMWMHIDKEDYSYARAGVAISDQPQGPYTFLHSVRPNGNMSRDMTLFQDDDGKAYHIFSSEENATMHICLLSDDYINHTAAEKRILINQSREAPAMFKYNGKYFLITSACTGWSPNTASWAVAKHPLGNWKQNGNPCVGDDSDITYNAQSSFVLPITGKPGNFIFMADRWNKINLEESRYVWLPLNMREKKPVITWLSQWSMDSFH